MDILTNETTRSVQRDHAGSDAAVAPRYDNVTILLHWTTVILVAAQWLGAELIDFISDRPAHKLYWSFHISLGVLLAFILAAHIWWRLTRGRRLPDSNSGLWGGAARAMHASLTLLPAALVFLGVAIILARGWNLFGVLAIPAIPGSSHQLARTITGIHGWTAHLLVFLTCGHAIAALVHQYLVRDGVLQRVAMSGLR